jgi:hypothetical protein
VRRELVWLEDRTFRAWSCGKCVWILLGSDPTATGKPPKAVQEAFDKHDSAKFARIADGRAKRPRDSSSA